MCVHACTEGAQSRREETSFLSWHIHLHLGSSGQSPGVTLRALRVYMRSGICPKHGISEPTVLEHQRHLNKNSTFLNATSPLVMIH